MITQADIELCNNYAATVKAQALALGLEIEYSSDPYAFAEFLSQQPETHGVSSIHDPSRSDIRRRDFAWMLAGNKGGPACCHAISVIETDNFIEEVITHRLYGQIEVVDRLEDVILYPEAEGLRLRGRIAIGGGLWVHPSWRGRDLSAVFRKVLRVVSIPRLHWDAYVSIFRNTPRRRAWAMADSWNTGLTPLSHGYYPPYKARLDVVMSHVSRQETLEFLRGEG